MCDWLTKTIRSADGEQNSSPLPVQYSHVNMKRSCGLTNQIDNADLLTGSRRRR